MNDFKFFLVICGFIINSCDCAGFNDYWSGFFGGPGGVGNAGDSFSTGLGTSSTGFGSGKDSYKGPTSYSTSFSSDYAGSGNFGNLNLNSPAITTSYQTYGPSSNNEFSSSSYINYPPSPSTFSNSHLPLGDSLNNFGSNSFNSHFGSTNNLPSGSYSYSNHHSSPPATSYGVPVTSNGGTAISQHIEVTRPIAVPVYKKFPFPVNKKFKVPIPHPVLVPVPAPFPVNIPIAEPVPVPVFKEIKVPVEKEVLYPVEKKVPVTVEKPVKFEVEKLYPVYVSNPYPVKIPIVKTLVHKPKGNGNVW